MMYEHILIRRQRMYGKNTLWLPGMDHASIATEAKVTKMLSSKGYNKKDLGRKKFLKHAWKWKEKYGGKILQQLKGLGASCDWDKTTFTMDEQYSNAVLLFGCAVIGSYLIWNRSISKLN